MYVHQAIDDKTDVDLTGKTMRRVLQSDQDLVDDAKHGSQDAFSTLVIRYRNRLLRQLSLVLRDSTEAEDVVQDTFIKAYKSLRHFRGESAFFTWIYRIAINTANQKFARSSRVSLLLDLSQQSAMIANNANEVDGDTPESRLENKQLVNVLNTILESLPDEQRTVFVLREIEGMSYEEIAERTQSPVGTVRSRIHRVRELVAAALRAHGLTDDPFRKTK